MPTSALRWGRIALGGVLAEVILIAAVIPMGIAGSGETAITILAVAGSFLVFVPVAWWLTRSLARPVLHGMLMGAFAAAIYTAVSLLAQLSVPDAPSVPPIYYLGHALKLAGGAAGGSLARRSAAARASTPARAG